MKSVELSDEGPSVTRLERALYAKWISRLGQSRVKDLAEGLKAGRSIAARSEAVVEAKNEEQLNQLLLEGFGGFFHQTVFLRRLEKIRQSADAIKEAVESGKPLSETIAQELTTTSSGEVRCLLMANRSMEFLLQGSGNSLFEEIQFPVAVGIMGDVLTVQVLTMQITIQTWSEIVGKELRRVLSAVSADALYEQALNFLRQSGVAVGDYIDYSKAAIRLMKRTDINTYSGTLEVSTAGQTKHDTVRGKGRRPLRESMPEKFNELISAKRIPNAEIEFGNDYIGLQAGSRVALYPTVGKMSFRSNLKGSDPDEFVRFMAT